MWVSTRAPRPTPICPVTRGREASLGPPSWRSSARPCLLASQSPPPSLPHAARRAAAMRSTEHGLLQTSCA